MSVTVKGQQEIERAIKDLLKITSSKKLWDECGKEAVDIIVERTISGLNVQGSAFIPYSKDYEKTGPPDLAVSGKMLDSVTFQSSDDICRVYISGSSASKLMNFLVKSFTGKSRRINNYDLALVHNEGGKSGKGKGFKMPKREFFGIVLEREWMRIWSIIEAHKNRILKVLNR